MAKSTRNPLHGKDAGHENTNYDQFAHVKGTRHLQNQPTQPVRNPIAAQPGGGHKPSIRGRSRAQSNP